MTLNFGQIKEWSKATGLEVFTIIKGEYSEIKDTARYTLAIYQNMLLIEMPAAGTNDQSRSFLIELVLFTKEVELNIATDCFL